MWPNPQDYNAAIQNLCLAFSDEVLRDSFPTLNSLGLPKPVSDSFASVYQMVARDGSQWAVRCFLRNVPDQAERYKHLSDALKLSSMPYTVPFEFIANGIGNRVEQRVRRHVHNLARERYRAWCTMTSLSSLKKPEEWQHWYTGPEFREANLIP